MDMGKSEEKQCDSLITSSIVPLVSKQVNDSNQLCQIHIKRRQNSKSQTNINIINLLLSVTIFVVISFLPSVSRTLFANCLKSRYGK